MQTSREYMLNCILVLVQLMEMGCYTGSARTPRRSTLRRFRNWSIPRLLAIVIIACRSLAGLTYSIDPSSFIVIVITRIVISVPEYDWNNYTSHPPLALQFYISSNSAKCYTKPLNSVPRDLPWSFKCVQPSSARSCHYGLVLLAVVLMLLTQLLYYY